MREVGSSLSGIGYGCELPAMVADWRAAAGLLTVALAAAEVH
eukprot:COSAG01_NODE_40738_length_460_cov_0.833795_1_plen_41_part_10